MYSEGTLCPDIPCSLADALVATVSSDLKGNELFLTRKRKKMVSHWENGVHKTLFINSFFCKTDSVSVHNALITLLVDVDHSVRLHLARDITILFPQALTPLEHMNNFKDAKKLLHQATLVKVSELHKSFSFSVSLCLLCFSVFLFLSLPLSLFLSLHYY